MDSKHKNRSLESRLSSGTDLALSNFADVAELDYEKILGKALNIFSDQAMLDVKPEDISIKDLEISKAKANNFLDAIAGFVELTHQVEVISASKDSFKRNDELKILNSMRRSCESSAKGVEKLLNKSLAHMEYLEGLDDEDVKVEDLAMLQSVLNDNISTSQKLIASLSRLIQLERMSGNRPYGQVRTSNPSVGHIKEFEKEDEGKKKRPVKEVSRDELDNILKSDDDEFGGF